MKTDIAIVGGGISGLYLAALLEQRGIDYVLLEARPRVGGRIYTKKEQTTGAIVDMGPAWIWDGQPRIANLAKQLGVNIFGQYSQGNLVFEDQSGQIRRDYQFSPMAGSLRIEGGLTEITDRLAQMLPENKCRISHHVSLVSKIDEGYKVQGRNDDTTFTIEVDRVVLSLPPRVIAETIEFEPTLNKNQLQSMQNISTWMAGHAKVLAIYEKPFWRDMGLSGDAMSHRGPMTEIHDASPMDGSAGALFGFVGIQGGSKYRQESTLKELARQQLQQLFGDDAAQPLEIYVKDWFEDPLTAVASDQAMGAHPQYGLPSALAELAKENIHFGSTEMGPQFGGFIEGALEAAENVMHQMSLA